MSEAQGGVARMARVPFKICVMRLVGTLTFRASSAALISGTPGLQPGALLTRMDSGQCHSDAPSDNQQSPRLTAPAIGRPIRSKSAIDR
jgi:hypothetical protein